MLIGEYRHRIDAKKRMSIPAKMRRSFGDRIVLTRGLDGCLFLYPLEEWQGIAEKLGKLAMGQSKVRQFVRLMLSGASEIDIDSLGRILLPDYLRSYANLSEKVVIAGVFNRAEIWSEDSWVKYREQANDRVEELAEELGNEGLF